MSNNRAGGGGQPELSKRAQYAQQKELEDYRRMGLAPLERDVRSGEEINPNIPSMISDAPFYMQNEGPTLQHQRNVKKELADTEAMKGSTNKTVVLGQAKKFRPGACKNCGAMGHKDKQCTEPKRKVGAVHSNAKIVHDTALVDESGLTNKTYQQKRDVWADVGSEHYNKVWSNFENGDDNLAEKRLKLEGTNPSASAGQQKNNNKGNTAEERGLFVAKSGDNVVSLRDVSDVPKYLQNLSNDNVFFDPKSRSMRTNPHQVGAGGAGGGADQQQQQQQFQGDNSMYEGSAEFKEALEMQHWLQTNPDIKDSFLPTENQRLFREWKAKKAAEVGQKERELEALYGKQEEVIKPIEASSNKNRDDGDELKQLNSEGDNNEGQNKKSVQQKPSSSSSAASEAAAELRRAELLGHSAIFGSFFDRATMKWGYKCCKQCGSMNVECTAQPVDA